MQVQFGRHLLDLNTPRVMGVLNVTPDSFYDGGCYYRQNGDIDNALRRAEAMALDGADFVDIGGESTRPGATSVSLQEEMDRVLPVVEAVCARLDIIISVDTSTPEIMEQAARLGAGFINDVRALQKPGGIEAAKKTGLPVCLMHMQGQPGSMQDAPEYTDVLEEVSSFMNERIANCKRIGIEPNQIVLDPGFGFGKSDQHNLRLLKHLEEISAKGYPVAVGLSRKSMLGRLLAREPAGRLAGSLALAHYALNKGVNILRTHDVAETVDMIKIFRIMQQK